MQAAIPGQLPASAPIAAAPIATAPNPADGIRTRDVEAELPWAALDADEDAVDPAEDDDPYTFWPASGDGLGGLPTPRYMPRPERPQWPTRDDAAVAPSPIAAQYASTPEPTPYAAGGFAAPGAYVPPLPAGGTPAGPAAPARAWAGHGADGRLPAVEPTREAVPAKRRDADSPARLAEFVGWLSVAGAAFASVGFLLPWGQVMIGSSGVGYFDRWGLAGPAHVVVVVGLLALLALGLARTDVPVRIRTGIGGLGLGALVLGLVWPYVVGPLGSGPGAQIVGIGALALIVSGLLAIVVDRGDRPGEVDRSA